MTESEAPGLAAGDYGVMEVGDLVEVSLNYPAVEGKLVTKVRVDMCCVRASQPIIVRFCHSRDAWVIEREIVHGFKETSPAFFQEVSEVVELALIPAYTVDHSWEDGRRIIAEEGEK